MTGLDFAKAPSGEDSASDIDPFAVTLGAKGLKRRSAHGSFTTAISQGSKFAIQLGSQVILARLLFPAEFGLIAMAYPVILFMQVFNDVGLGQVVVQRPNLGREQVSALFWVNILSSLLLCGVVALLAPLAAWIYGEPNLIFLTIVLGLLLPLSATSTLPAAILARHMHFGLLARNDVVAMFAGTAVTVICALRGLSYWSLVAGQFATVATGNVLTWRSCDWRPTRPKFSATVWEDVKFGGNITLSNLAAFVTTSGDNMIVGLTAGKVPLGLYDRSYNLVVQPISQMLAPLNRVAVPLLSRLAGEAEQYRVTYLQMFRISTLLTVPAMLVCISNGGAVIGALLGPRWSATAPIFSWISVGGLTVGLYSSTFWLFITQNRSPELRLYSALAAAINVASYLIGAFWGVIGIATAASIGYVFVTTPLMLFGATRKGPVSLADAVNCSIPFAIETIMVYGVLTLGLRGSALHDIARVIVATLLSYGFFVGLALVSAANRQLLRGGIRMLKSQR